MHVDDDVDMPDLIARGNERDDGLLAAASLLLGLGDALLDDGESAAAAAAVPAGKFYFFISYELFYFVFISYELFYFVFIIWPFVSHIVFVPTSQPRRRWGDQRKPRGGGRRISVSLR